MPGRLNDDDRFAWLSVSQIRTYVDCSDGDVWRAPSCWEVTGWLEDGELPGYILGERAVRVLAVDAVEFADQRGMRIRREYLDCDPLLPAAGSDSMELAVTVAVMFGVSESTVSKWRADGTLPNPLIERDLHEWLAASKAKPGDIRRYSRH